MLRRQGQLVALRERVRLIVEFNPKAEFRIVIDGATHIDHQEHRVMIHDVDRPFDLVLPIEVSF